MAAGDPDQPALAVCGSACAGPWPFTAALRIRDLLLQEVPAPGVRTDLAVLVRRLCQRGGIEPGGLREIRVDVGPGSYVGLRVAVTFARVLAQWSGATLRSIGSLDAMAAAHLAAHGERAWLRPVLDARRGRLHTARFGIDDGVLTVAEPPAALTHAEFAERLRGDELVLASTALHDALAPAVQAAGAALRPPDPVAAITLFVPCLPAPTADPRTVEPLYGMASYAEDTPAGPA